MDRINFIENVSGIHYPEMIVDFFDHFVALKQLVEDSGTVRVLNSTNNSISFSIEFKNSDIKTAAVNVINSLNGTIIIYNRPISIAIEITSEDTIIINLT